MAQFIIATRGSRLALWQANHIKEKLELANPTLEIRLKIIKTKGDRILDVPLAKIGGKGLFVKEIEEALVKGEADIAVHSMKDVPMALQEGLMLAAIPERGDAADLFLSVRYESLETLPENACVGTSSLRRQAQLLAMRPDLRIVSLRGNVDTRLKKLEDGDFDAIIMAQAGMKRLNLHTTHMQALDVTSFIPAAGQGALGLECASHRQDVLDALIPFDHAPTRLCVSAERAFLRSLDGSCQVPIAAYAHIENETKLHLEGLVGACDGSTLLRSAMQIDSTNTEPERLGQRLAAHLRAQGADELLAMLYDDSPTA